MHINLVKNIQNKYLLYMKIQRIAPWLSFDCLFHQNYDLLNGLLAQTRVTRRDQ
jgi:hypothetical protein